MVVADAVATCGCAKNILVANVVNIGIVLRHVMCVVCNVGTWVQSAIVVYTLVCAVENQLIKNINALVSLHHPLHIIMPRNNQRSQLTSLKQEQQNMID